MDASCATYTKNNINRLEIICKVVGVVVSHIQRTGCQPEKLLNTMANPARGLLNREKRTKRESMAAYLHPLTLLFRRK